MPSLSESDKSSACILSGLGCVLAAILLPMAILVIWWYVQYQGYSPAVCHLGDARTVYNVDWGSYYATASISTYASLDVGNQAHQAVDSTTLVFPRKRQDMVPSTNPLPHRPSRISTSLVDSCEWKMVCQVFGRRCAEQVVCQDSAASKHLPLGNSGGAPSSALSVTLIFPSQPQDLQLQKRDDVETFISAVKNINITCLIGVGSQSNPDIFANYPAVLANTPIIGWCFAMVVGGIAFIVFVVGAWAYKCG